MAMLGMVSMPNANNRLRTSLAPKPIASENARTVHGTCSDALVFRGAAVDTVFRC